MREKVFALLSLAAPIVLALSLLAAPARASTFTLSSSGGTFSGGNLVINPFTVDVGPGDLDTGHSGPTPFGATLQYRDVGILSASGGITDDEIVSYSGSTSTGPSDTIDIAVTHNATGVTETVAPIVFSFSTGTTVFDLSIILFSGVLGPVQGLFDVLNLEIVLAGSGPFSVPGAYGLELRHLTVHVPEPATIGLFGLALAGLGFARRRQR